MYYPGALASRVEELFQKARVLFCTVPRPSGYIGIVPDGVYALCTIPMLTAARWKRKPSSHREASFFLAAIESYSAVRI